MNKIVAAFQGMHVLPAKHSNARLPKKCDYQTDRQTYRRTDRQSDMCRYASKATQKLVYHYLRLSVWPVVVYTVCTVETE